MKNTGVSFIKYYKIFVLSLVKRQELFRMTLLYGRKEKVLSHDTGVPRARNS